MWLVATGNQGPSSHLQAARLIMQRGNRGLPAACRQPGQSAVQTANCVLELRLCNECIRLCNYWLVVLMHLQQLAGKNSGLRSNPTAATRGT